MSKSKYHSEVIRNIGSEENPHFVPSKKLYSTLADVKAEDGTPLKVGRTGVYVKASDGSLRRTVPKISKEERRRNRDSQNS